MNRKKTLLLLLTALLLTVLAGCPQAAEKGAGQEETGVSPQQEEATGPAAQEQPSPDAAVPRTEQLFDALEIDVEKGSLNVCTGDSFSYVREGGGDADYEIAGGTLYIDQRQDHKTVLTLPKDQVYTSLRLTVGEGHIYGESVLPLRTLELYVKRGEVTLSGVSVADSSTVEVSQGAAFLSGSLGNSVAAYSEEGSLRIEADAAQSDYDFEIELLTGNIHLGSENYHGLSFSKSIDNGAGQSMELRCSRGELSVDFAGRH